ncbi:MAG: hypothetical protein ACRD3Q_08990, partial [Terriglobales bacterium]
MEAIRWPAVLLTVTILAGTAGATGPFAAPQQPAGQTQTAAGLPPQTEGPHEESAPQPPVGPDRRDKIFYPGDTERLKPLGRKLVLNILLDQKEIFTSPFHINRENAKWWLLSGVTTAGLIA